MHVKGLMNAKRIFYNLYEITHRTLIFEYLNSSIVFVKYILTIVDHHFSSKRYIPTVRVSARIMCCPFFFHSRGNQTPT